MNAEKILFSDSELSFLQNDFVQQTYLTSAIVLESRIGNLYIKKSFSLRLQFILTINILVETVQQIVLSKERKMNI